MTYSKEIIWEKPKHMELNLFINIFKKEPGNIPPWAGDAQSRSGGEWQGKRQTEQDFFFLKFCFLFSKENQERPGNPPYLAFPTPPPH